MRKRLLGAFAGIISLAIQGPAMAATEGMPQWLIVLTLARPELQDPKNWSDKDNAAVGAHFSRLQKMTDEGKVVFFGRTQDTTPDGHLVPDTTGLIVLEVPDRAAAEAVLRDDPAVTAGLMRGKVFSYKIALQRK